MAKKRTKKELTYFFLDGDLHMTYHVNRGGNIATCWNYKDRKFVQYAWSDVQRRAERAYTTKEVAKMVDRYWMVVQQYIYNEEIPKPQKSYPITNYDWEKAHFRWSEKDIMRLHDLMLTKHRGRPRKDGLVNTFPMPTKAQLQAIMRNESITYIKDEDGNIKPVWKENSW